MLASRNLRYFVIAAAAVSLSACDYECGEARTTVANGTLRAPSGVPLAAVQANLSDNVNPSFLRLGVGVTATGSQAGEPLKGHVTRARFVTESGELLAEIPTSTETLYLTTVVALNIDLPNNSEYERVRSALLTGRAKVILDTNVAGLEHLEATLSDAHDNPPNLRRCRFVD